MDCPKCQRQMDHLHQLKRYECYYCDYTLHEHLITETSVLKGSMALALEIINHAATMGCKCQSTGPDVDSNRHWPLCIVGKAQTYLGQKVSRQAR